MKVAKGLRPGWLAGAMLAVVMSLFLSACAGVGASPSSAQPPKSSVPAQVVYRIDDHRYFELTPDETCFGNMLYFVDTAKGIHSEVVTFDAVMNRTTLIIDAANDQYLVAPVTRGGTDCSSGGGACGGNRMPYSTDGGKTWKRVWSSGSEDDLMVGGSTAYHSYRFGEARYTDGIDLATLGTQQEAVWNSVRGFIFQPRIAPVDTKVVCKAGGNGKKHER